MKEYKEAEVEIITFESSDVITSSIDGGEIS